MNQDPNIFWILVNGILNNPESIDSWTDRFEISVEKKGHHCIKMEYRADGVFRRIFQGRRAQNLNDICEELDGERIRIVAHSNGGDIVDRMMGISSVKIEEIHMVASASQPDMRKSFIPTAIRDDRLERAFFYCSKRDRTLAKAAPLTKKLFGWAGLGYDNVGFLGPQDIPGDVVDDIETIWWEYDHSDMWLQNVFESTVFMIMNQLEISSNE